MDPEEVAWAISEECMMACCMSWTGAASIRTGDGCIMDKEGAGNVCHECDRFDMRLSVEIEFVKFVKFVEFVEFVASLIQRAGAGVGFNCVATHAFFGTDRSREHSQDLGGSDVFVYLLRGRDGGVNTIYNR